MRSNALLDITSAHTRPPTAAVAASSRLLMRKRPSGPAAQIERWETKQESKAIMGVACGTQHTAPEGVDRG